MRHLIAAFAALAALAFAAPAAAQTISKSQTGDVGTVINCTDTSGATVKCVLPMATPVTAAGVPMGSTTSPTVVQGNIASAATDSGNPVKIGGVYNSTAPTFTNGQRGDVQIDTRGNTRAAIYGADSQTPIATNSLASDGLASPGGGTNLASSAFGRLFNGSTWDRAFTCASQASVNVTAGSTTQIVALSGSTVIRVCTVTLSMSAAGTAKFVNGTGANCGTGTADLTPAITLGTTTPLSLTAPAGGSVLRATAANALCVAAVTGNVTGWITYAQY